MNRIACALFWLALSSGSAHAVPGFESVDVAGGFLWNDGNGDNFQKSNDSYVRGSVWLRATEMLSLSPFVAYAAGDGDTKTIGGIHAIYRATASDLQGALFVGPGLGAISTDGRVELLATAIAGVKYPLNERSGILLQSNYSYATGSVPEGFSVNVGVTFAPQR